VHTQIPWATAGAERSRQRELDRIAARISNSNSNSLSLTPSPSPSPTPSPGIDGSSPSPENGKGPESASLTREEKLLAELLRANEELADALRIYSDIERIGVEGAVERAAKERSKVETRGVYGGGEVSCVFPFSYSFQFF
jgi:hypothetical protein